VSEWLVLAAVVLAGASGLPGLFLGRASNAGQHAATAIQLAAAVLGIWSAWRGLLVGPGSGVSLPLAIPGGEISVVVDPLSAAFLLPIFLVSALSALFGEGYWKQSERPRNGRQLRLFYGLLTAGLALLVVSRNGVCFLIGWEFMALSCFFAMTTDDDQEEVREAGWIYFASTHLSTLILFAFFALYYVAKGSLALAPFTAGSLSPGMANALFLLALAGFGLKAGLYPLHFWLPPAHASAPSHVSALMSGVLIKMGVYGMLRTLWLFPDVPGWWAASLLGLGCLSGVLGVAFAIGQHDLKRLLAYHSIENIGIIFMGLGLAAAGRSLGRGDLVALGLGGAVLHTWNHGLFKALLFLAAGSAIHAVHTREIDRLGGLAKLMPMTAFFFLVGAVAICGLPPLNGFVSETLVYLGLFRAGCLDEGSTWLPALLAIPVLALIGGLALACFVKVHGAVFLGTPRTEHACHVLECGPAMLAPMAMLAGLCAVIGLAPAAVAPLLDAVAGDWAPHTPDSGPSLAALAPLGWLSITGAVTAVLAALGGVVFLRRGAAPPHALPTWDCGYARPSPAMQYTASSFARMIVSLFKWVLLPRRKATHPEGPFPAAAVVHSQVPDAVLDRLILPIFGALAWACSWFRLLQRGRVNAYLFYIFITLLVLLLWK
jgi:hydrogenase-4 component B